MKHKMKISVSKQPPEDGVVSVKRVTIRERFFRKLFGNPKRVTILVPGDTVQDVTITKIDERGDKDAN